MTTETNTRKATGPTSPEGKARSAMNALKHGLYAKHAVVLVNESREDLEKLRDEYYEQFLPATPLERDLVEELISLRWRLRRILDIETATIDHQIGALEDEIQKRYTNMDTPGRHSIATLETEAFLQSVRRFESSYSRQHERVLRQLYRAQQERLRPEAGSTEQPAEHPAEAAEPRPSTRPKLQICRNELPDPPESGQTTPPQRLTPADFPPEEAA